MQQIKDKHLKLYMDLACRISEESYATRLKVGCIIIKDDNPISFSWNGTPPTFDNTCEDLISTESGEFKLVTKNLVLHAEENAIGKLAKNGISADDAILFVTHAPCINCARLIFKSGIKNVFYKNVYRSTEGLEFLSRTNVHCEMYPISVNDIENDGNITI